MKKIILLILSAQLLCASAAAHWADPALEWASERGVDADILAEPDAAIDRAEAAALFYQTAGSPATEPAGVFSDVAPDAPYAAAVEWARSAGYVTGFEDGTYRPGQNVTRQEFAAMMYRAAGEPETGTAVLAGYPDGSSVAEWAQPAMAWCVENGLIRGRDDGTLCPRDTITAAEGVSLLRRIGETGETVAVTGLDDMDGLLRAAIAAAEQPPAMDVSGLDGTETLEMDVRNVYYAITSDCPEYKYAYDMQTELDAGVLRCRMLYMPYRTGDFAEDFAGTEVDSLRGLMDTAEAALGAERLDIRITDPELKVDDMNRALGQVGGSYILCRLSRDGTAIEFTPAAGLTMEEGLEKLAETDRLAEELTDRYTTPDMSTAEKAEAVYTALTDTVKYDRRYYDDRASMPYDSMTAYGALHDSLAICGGYAQAVQVLFDKLGIECYTVSGTAHGEYHMWNIARLDGEWLYFDATADRGMSGFGFRHFAVGEDGLAGYEWDSDIVAALTGTAA